jgi:hypothetical protein
MTDDVFDDIIPTAEPAEAITEEQPVAPQETPQGAQLEETHEDDDDHEEEAKPEPQGRKPRALREKEKRLEIQSERDALKEQLAIERYRNEQLRTFKELQEQKQPTQDDDALLRAAGIDPETLVDKEAIVAMVKQNNAIRAAAQSNEESRHADAIRGSILTAQAQNPDFSDAVAFYAEQKALEARAVAEALGVQATEDDVRQAVVNKTQEIVNQAYRAGKDPAQALMTMAKTMGYKPQPKPLTKGDGLDYNALNNLRDAAGKPAYQAESAIVNTKAPKVYGDGRVEIDW